MKKQISDVNDHSNIKPVIILNMLTNKQEQ